jgi:hypothetical protein
VISPIKKVHLMAQEQMIIAHCADMMLEAGCALSMVEVDWLTL